MNPNNGLKNMQNLANIKNNTFNLDKSIEPSFVKVTRRYLEKKILDKENVIQS